MPQAATPTGWTPVAEPAATTAWKPVEEPAQFLGPPTKPATISNYTLRQKLTPTRSTQRLIGGMATAAAATAAMTNPIGWVGGAVAALGAAVGGAGTKAYQDLYDLSQGGPPKAPGQAASDIIGAGAEQAAYEVGGQLVSWPVKAVGRSMVAPLISSHATKALEATRTARGAQLDLALTQAEDVLKQAPGKTTEEVASVKNLWPRPTTAPPVRPVASHAPPGFTVPGPARYAPTGRAVNDVIQGPVRDYLGDLGASVGEAAKSGPDVNIAGTRTKITRMFNTIYPTASTNSQATSTIVDAYGKHFPGTRPLEGKTLTVEQMLSTLEQGGSAPDNPESIPKILQQILEAPDDIVSFENAHRWKRLLGEKVPWDHPAKTQLVQIQKGTQLTLREAMRGHAPYDQATAAYEALHPQVNKGVAQQLRQQALQSPESLISGDGAILKPNRPTRFGIVRDLLLKYAPEGGGEAEGKAAWDQVLAAFTYQHLIRLGVEKLDASLAKIHPDILKMVEADPQAKAVVGRLRVVSQAMRTAQEAGEASLGTAKAGVATAKEAIVAAKAPTAAETAYAESSLATPPPPKGQLAVDLLQLGMPGHPFFKLGAGGRLWRRGPRLEDLVYWASLSNQRTQLFVKAVTSPTPGMALADLARGIGIWNEQTTPPPTKPQPQPSH